MRVSIDNVVDIANQGIYIYMINPNVISSLSKFKLERENGFSNPIAYSSNFSENIDRVKVDDKRNKKVKETFNRINLAFSSALMEKDFDLNLSNIYPWFDELLLLNIFSTLVTKNDTEFENTGFKDVIFPSLQILKLDKIPNPTKKITNDKVMKNFRNALAHNDYSLFVNKDNRLSIIFRNNQYFTGVIAFEDIVPYIDKLPIDYNDEINLSLLRLAYDVRRGYIDKSQEHTNISGIIMQLNLIFNSNKEHYLDDYASSEYGKIYSADFECFWDSLDKEHIYEDYYKKYNRKYDGFTEDFPREILFPLIGKKPELIQMFIKTTSDILAEQNLAFDNKNKVRVPNEYFLTKIRNAVAHGHYMYDKEKDSFYFWDVDVKNDKERNRKKGDINFRAGIKREKLISFLSNDFFMENLKNDISFRDIVTSLQNVNIYDSFVSENRNNRLK